jgi:hypothetical protein
VEVSVLRRLSWDNSIMQRWTMRRRRRRFVGIDKREFIEELSLPLNCKKEI